MLELANLKFNKFNLSNDKRHGKVPSDKFGRRFVVPLTPLIPSTPRRDSDSAPPDSELPPPLQIRGQTQAP
ncbi:hypothetical protein TIFTF001_002772 [Ficus carica]|uniref:Uncharacterized protein n=1 Tax=Ficus carica TaxID=3494 RepID=A0AA87Z553_FICCA|nr:hypothetical protein TIFTF001_002772 [Ficus carica]